MLRKTFGSIAAATLLTASAMMAASAADFGPMPVDYEQTAASYIEGRLHNVRGARIQIVGEPYQVYSTLSGYEGLATWAVDVRVKSRLPSGSYGSYQRYTVLFLDGDAIALEGDARRVTRL